jgi:hypothetical protein
LVLIRFFWFISPVISAPTYWKEREPQLVLIWPGLLSGWRPVGRPEATEDFTGGRLVQRSVEDSHHGAAGRRASE